MIKLLWNLFKFWLNLFFFSLFKRKQLLQFFNLRVLNSCLNNLCHCSFQSSFITLCKRVLKRRLNVSHNTVVNWNSDISNVCYCWKMSHWFMENCFALFIFIFWNIVFCLFNFSRHYFCRALLFNNYRFNILPWLYSIFNQSYLIFKSFIFIFKIFQIIKLLLISFFDCSKFKLVCLNWWFKLKHLVLTSLLFL